MPVIELMPFRHTQSCSINAQGTVSFPLPLLEKLNWSFGAKIAVSYIAAPVILLLHKAPDGRPGFTLSPLNHGNPGQSGGKITCAQFAQRVLHPRLVLPIRGIAPVFISVAPYELALVLQPPNWVTTEFSQAGCQKIPWCVYRSTFSTHFLLLNRDVMTTQRR